LSTGGPISAILIIIGARPWRRRRLWLWRRRATTIRSRRAVVEESGARGTVGHRQVAPARTIFSTIPTVCFELATPTTSTSARAGCRRLRQERTDRSDESALEGDPSIRSVLPQVSGCALLTTGTIPALHAWIGRWPVQRKRRIQPQHVDFHIIPERNRHDVAAVQRLAHGRRTPLFCIVVHVPEERLLGLAKCIRDGVGVVRSQDRRSGTLDHVAILDVVPHHLGELPVVRPIGGEELRHDRDGLQCVDFVL